MVISMDELYDRFVSGIVQGFDELEKLDLYNDSGEGKRKLHNQVFKNVSSGMERLQARLSSEGKAPGGFVKNWRKHRLISDFDELAGIAQKRVEKEVLEERQARAEKAESEGKIGQALLLKIAVAKDKERITSVLEEGKKYGEERKAENKRFALGGLLRSLERAAKNREEELVK